MSAHVPIADPLVTEEIISAVDHAELRRRAETLPLAIDLEAPEGTALLRSLLFEHWVDLLPAHVDLTELSRFYNQYFWFVRCAALCQAAHGLDAGLEQQVFRLLESQAGGVDFDLLADLDLRARN